MAPTRKSVITLLLASLAAAKRCVNVTVPVDVEARQALYNEVKIEGNQDAAKYVQDLTRNGFNYSDTILKGYQTLRKSYKISAQFCHPDSGISDGPVQLLTHGVGFDKV
jgi:hypothetical protein